MAGEIWQTGVMTSDTVSLAPTVWRYDRREMVADGIVHVIGVASAVAGAAVLIAATVVSGKAGSTVPAIVYAAGLLTAFAASMAYNLWPVSPMKWLLRRLDHSAIFVLIAATYTPFLAELPAGAVRTGLLAGLWSIAAVGIALKVAFPGRYDKAAVAAYLAMGWSGLAAGPAIFPVLSTATLTLIVVGGVVYSTGVIFHLWNALRFQNAIWHSFVLAGAAVHYVAVYRTLVP